MHFKVLLLLATVVTACLSADDVDFSNLKCKGVPAPANGKLECKAQPNSQAVRCELKCNPVYDVTYLAAKYYVCNADGTWTAFPSYADTRWPDCKIYGRGEPVP